MSAKDLKEASKDLPENWKVFHSKKSDRLYYYNTVTKKTQWHHPSLGDRNEEKSKCKKRKPHSDEQNRVESEGNKQSLKHRDEKNRESSDTHRKEISNCGNETSKLPVKTFFKPLPKLSFKLKATKPLADTKNSVFSSKSCKESNIQKFGAHNKNAKTNVPTTSSLTKTDPQESKPSNQAGKSNLEATKSVEQGEKSNLQVSNKSKEQRKPALFNSKTQKKVKKLGKLPPLTPSLCEDSDSTRTSGSSDRILSWVADTSKISFKNHPIPKIDISASELAKSQGLQYPATIVKRKSEMNNEKLTGDLNKIARPKAVETTLKQKGDVLNATLPKHSQTHGKRRYAPYSYQLTTLNQKHDKAKNSSKTEQEKRRSSETAAKSIASHTVKVTTANQNGVSSELTNHFSGGNGGKSTNDQNGVLVSETVVSKDWTTNSFGFSDDFSTGVGNDKNIDNASRKCSLQDSGLGVQQFVDREAIQELGGGVFENVLQEDDVLSMEEGAGSSPVWSSSNVADMDMDIDNAEEFAEEIIKELKEMRSSLVVRPDQINWDELTDFTSHLESYQYTIISSDKMAMKMSSEGYEDKLYIVLDTNVLLSHLKFVTELKDLPIPGVGMPVLVVPWVVVQELDSLKESKWKLHECGQKTTKVDILAKLAIKFLNGSFEKSDPRVRGQTISEAKENVVGILQETNDDRILQCCLLFHSQAQNGSCVLFSNDVNLCNKAMINGVKAFNREKLLPGLKDLFQGAEMVKQHSEEYNAHLANEENLARRRQKADDILCELQIILREGLSYIIEIEMKNAYDDLWLEIVSIKPPWTLVDVLQLLDKHWIAVFGHILKRDKKQLIFKLQEKFDKKKGTSSSLQFCSEMLQLALELYQSFGSHASYDDAIPKCLAAVNVLVQKCEQFQSSDSTGDAQASEASTSKLTIGAISQDHVVTADETVSHQEARRTFDLIWTAVIQFSTQIFTALGFPTLLTDGTAQDFPTPSREEAISFLGFLRPSLENVVNSIRNVLCGPWERVSQTNSLFIQLEHAIAVFMREALGEENHATAEQLFKYCEDPLTRTSLVEGLSQLEHACAMLQHCALCVDKSNSM